MSQGNPDHEALYRLQKERQVAALTGGFAHDFNNLLTSVIGQIDLALLDTGLPPQTRECLVRALASAKRGAELNTKLVQFSRDTQSRPGPASATKLVEDTIFLVRRGIDRKVQIRHEPPQNPVWPVWADEGRCLQALISLCLNARDAMPDGGELSIELANRSFTPEEARPPRRAGDFVRISVSDTGPGMTPDAVGRLVEPDWTGLDSSRSEGPGLAIANHGVRESGGWVEVESEPGHGSRVQVYLPRAQSSTAAIAKAGA